MIKQLTATQKEYLQSQLQYDHNDDPPPPNTLAVHQIQHQLIFRSVRDFAAGQEVHMLDVGCGWGDFSEMLNPFLKSYVGLEPSPVELGRFTPRPGRFLVRGIGENMEFLKDQSRNFILLNSVLDHCFDWHETFGNCLRVLAPGGLLIISMENSQKLTVRLRERLGRRHVHQGHLEFFGVTKTLEMLRPNFQIREACTLGFLFGLHAVTKKLPLPVAPLRAANRLANSFFGLVSPNGGHIFFIAAVRNGTPAAPDGLRAPFRCPRCQAGLVFGGLACQNCGFTLAYHPKGWLDTVELNPGLQAEMKSK